MTNLSIFNQLRPFSVGFDDMFNHFDSMVSMAPSSYPPYNIVKTGKHTYDVEVALAGYGKKDIDVTYEDGMLTIKSIKDKETKEVEDNEGMLHKGIAKRMFSKSFTIADDVVVKGAELKDGLLKVSMERVIPEAKKARTITIK